MYCYPQVKRDNFGCSWHSNQLELIIFGDMSAYICVLTMTYLKESVSLPLVWVHGHTARDTKKNPCVIDYRRYFSHLLMKFKDIGDFSQVPCPLWAHQFVWRLKHVCENGSKNTLPPSVFPRFSRKKSPRKTVLKRKVGNWPRRRHIHRCLVRGDKELPNWYRVASHRDING